MPFDPMYILMVLLPGLVISGFASFLVRTAFNKYSQVRSSRGYTGAHAATRERRPPRSC
jgi:Zn-dependent membrane protease YugP